MKIKGINKLTSRAILLLLCIALSVISACGSSSASQEDTSNNIEPEKPESKGQGGYLFAHMTKDNYGKLFYAVSRDGKQWEELNNGKIILESYLGHPNIELGGDGKYYMIGVSLSGELRKPILYYSQDLVTWYHRDLDRAIFDVEAQGYENESVYIGAPKIFYDSDSQNYMITWHAYLKGKQGDDRWRSMRTFYILTKDWNEFTPAKRLFDFSGIDANMATIDAIFVKDNNTYYAIIKDERWPSDVATGKTIRIATSKSLTGPYSNPGNPITPAWHEAPTIVRKPDGKGWYLYSEKYTESQYECFESQALVSGMWAQVIVSPPSQGRHGCVLKIPENIYQGILKAYKNSK